MPSCPSNMKLTSLIQILYLLADSKASLVQRRRTNEIELNNCLSVLIEEISQSSSVMILEQGYYEDVNMNKLANMLQEKCDRPISVSPTIENWFELTNKISTQTNVITLIFGRFDFLKAFLKVIWDKALVSYSQKYIIITDENSFKLVAREKEIKDVFHLIFLSMDEERDEGIFNLYDIDPRRNNQIVRFGIWRKGLTKVPREIFQNHFVDFGGNVIECTFIPLFPYVNVLSESSLNNVQIDGMDYDIITSIGERLNFNIKFVRSNDKIYGNINETTKQYNGIIGMIQRQETDVAIGSIIVTYERYQHIDYSFGLSQTKISFLTQKPNPLPKWKAIFSPFKPSLWMCLLITQLGFICLNILLLTLTSECKKGSSIILISVHNTWSSFINQGIKHPSRSSLRILWASWFLFSLCIISSYAGSLFSWLTFPAYEPTIDSLNDLLNSKLIILIQEGTYFKDLLKSSNDEIFQRTYKRIYRGPALCKKFSECIFFINDNKGYSFISEEDAIESFISTVSIYFPSKLRMAKEGLYNLQTGTVFRKNHPLKHEYNNYILKIQQSGLENYWRHQYLFKKRLNNSISQYGKYMEEILKSEDKDGQESLSLESLQGAFMLYALGMACSMIIFLIEKKKVTKLWTNP